MNGQVQTATSEPLFNPLAPELIRNPYPHYERLRTTDPMHLTPLGVFVGQPPCRGEPGDYATSASARIMSSAPSGAMDRKSWRSRSSAA